MANTQGTRGMTPVIVVIGPNATSIHPANSLNFENPQQVSYAYMSITTPLSVTELSTYHILNKLYPDEPS